MRAGKRLTATTTEVMVRFKRPPLSRVSRGETNYVRFRLSPDVTIAMGAHIKRRGEELIGDPTELRVVHQTDADEMGAYAAAPWRSNGWRLDPLCAPGHG